MCIASRFSTQMVGKLVALKAENIPTSGKCLFYVNIALLSYGCCNKWLQRWEAEKQQKFILSSSGSQCLKWDLEDQSQVHARLCPLQRLRGFGGGSLFLVPSSSKAAAQHLLSDSLPSAPASGPPSLPFAVQSLLPPFYKNHCDDI